MYFVYIMTNRSKTLYTAVTNNLVRRVREHKTGIGSGFTAKYKLDRLVYFERFQDVHNAIEREKRIKGWLRIKKMALVIFDESMLVGFERGVVQASPVPASDLPTRQSLICHPEPRGPICGGKPPRERPALSEVEGTYILRLHHDEPLKDSIRRP